MEQSAENLAMTLSDQSRFDVRESRAEIAIPSTYRPKIGGILIGDRDAETIFDHHHMLDRVHTHDWHLT